MNLQVKDIAKKHYKDLKLDFEDIYISVRRLEKRIYTDDQLRLLPDTDHIHPDEWKIRKRSGERLCSYVHKNRKFLNILEVGCGNGWLSAKLSNISDTRVIGLDINYLEIEQASRVFKKENLEFLYDTFNDSTFDNQRFDLIIFADSLQYFPSVITVLQQATALLKRGGEIHIMDTPFYDAEEAGRASERSHKYYNSLGYPDMAEYYFHHSISELWGFKYEVLFNPINIFNRLFKKDPFYWIVVRK